MNSKWWIILALEFVFYVIPPDRYARFHFLFESEAECIADQERVRQTLEGHGYIVTKCKLYIEGEYEQESKSV